MTNFRGQNLTQLHLVLRVLLSCQTLQLQPTAPTLQLQPYSSNLSNTQHSTKLLHSYLLSVKAESLYFDEKGKSLDSDSENPFLIYHVLGHIQIRKRKTIEDLEVEDQFLTYS